MNVTPTVTNLDGTGKIVTLSVPPVVATTVDQNIVYSVSYKGGAAGSTTNPIKVLAVPAEKIAPVITPSAATINVAAEAQSFTFTVADEANGSGVDTSSIVVKQGTTSLTATAVADQANTYQVSLNEVKGANQTLTIDAKDKAGNAATTASVTLVDKTLPTIKSVQALNNKTIVITYSEPVASAQALSATNYTLYNKASGQTDVFAAVGAGAGVEVSPAFADVNNTQVKLQIVTTNAVAGYPMGGLSDGAYILYTSNIQDTATTFNTIIPASNAQFMGSLTPDTIGAMVVSSTYSATSGDVVLNFDKVLTETMPADNKLAFKVGSNSANLVAADYTATFDGTTKTQMTFTLSTTGLAKVNALGDNPTIVISAGAFANGTSLCEAAETTPVISTGPMLSSVTYNENTNVATFKFSKIINVAAITSFSGAKFNVGGVDIQDADMVFQNTTNSTDLSFKLSDAKAQAVESAVRGGNLTASVAAGTVSDTATPVTTNVAATSSAALVVGTSYIQDTTAPTLTGSKFNADSKVLELDFNEPVRNNIADIVKASVEFYQDDNGVPGLQTTAVNGVAADTKIADFADVDSLSATNNHAIDGTAGYLVTDATAGTPATADSEKTSLFFIDKDATATNNLDQSLSAVAAGTDIYANILAGGIKDANTNATTAAQSVKVTKVAVSNTSALTSATAVTNVSLGEITVAFANAGGAVAMDPTTATNPANYDLYLAANPLNKVSVKNIIMNADNTVATIFFNSPLSADNYALKTSGLKTASGVASNIDGTTLAAEPWTAAPNATTLDAAQALTLTDKDSSGTVSAGDEVTVVFSEAAKLPTGFQISDVTVNNSHSLGNSTFTLGSDNKTFTIKLGSSSTLAVGDKLSFPATIKDFEDVALVTGAGAETTNALTVSGNVAPKLLSAVYADTNADGVVSTGDILTIKFNQNVAIAPGKVAADLIDDIVVGGTTFTAASLSGDTLTLTVGTAGFAVGDNVDVNAATVDIVNSWGTPAGTGVKAIGKSDVTVPTVTGVSYKAATHALTFTFSEAVHTVLGPDANSLAAALAANITPNGGTLGGGFTAATLSPDNKSVTITLDGTEALDQYSTISLAAGTFGNATNNLEDASNNIAVRGQGTPYTLTITQ